MEVTQPSPASRFLPTATPLGRLLLLGVLFLVLQMPLSMIRDVVNERSQRRAEAAGEITASWGGPQAVIGPLLRIRCLEHRTVQDANGGTQERTISSMIYLLPEKLAIGSALRTQTRRRGLFEVPVYTGSLQLDGSFARPTPTQCPGGTTEIDWSQTQLVLGVREPRGLHGGSGLVWNGERRELKPATGVSAPALASGVHVPLPGAEAFPESLVRFNLTLALNGSQSLQFAPVGKDTQVKLNADWPHPSFQGAWLPSQRSTAGNSINAAWSVSYLGRDYPQMLTSLQEQGPAMEKSLFGVALLQPVDTYVMAQRITKYAILTVLFTFLTVWLTEILSGRRVHPIQYGFLGAALCLFGLLQLALAEHLGFLVAFLAAAAAVTGLVTLYCRSVLQNGRRALAVGGLLAGLYAYLYSLLRAEDYALLGGSLALFALLALAMYLTRRIDWSGST